MSRFSLLVAGYDFTEQLLQYRHFESNGVETPHVKEVDITHETIAFGTDLITGEFNLAVALTRDDLDSKVVAHESEIDLDGLHKYGHAIVQEGRLIRAVVRSNPNSKWSDCAVGGMWSKTLKLKPGRRGLAFDQEQGLVDTAGWADIAVKKDIDFEGMRTSAMLEAAKIYDAAITVLNGSLATYTPWIEYEVKATFDNYEELEAEYSSQEAVVLLASSGLFHSEMTPAAFMCSRSEYVKREVTPEGITSAVVKDGQWRDRDYHRCDETLDDKAVAAAWHQEYHEIIDSIDDHEQLVVLDCRMTTCY